MADEPEIPLSILVLDTEASAARVLIEQATSDDRVRLVRGSSSVDQAQVELRSGDYNAIFVDPLTVGLEEASRFIFSVRAALPEIVFVLFVDQAKVESHRTDFFAGERRRFSHFYRLDKQTPIAAWSDEVRAVLTLCIADLSWRLSAESLKKIRETVERSDDTGEGVSLSPALTTELDRAISLVTPSSGTRSGHKIVFLSHRFAEQEYVDGLTQLLQQDGFEVLIGAPANTFVSQGILQYITNADYFVCLMTRDKEKVDGTFTTSPWLLEEKGAALALRKPIVMLVEQGVDDFGGLQGDWQRIHFGEKGFLKAALQAVRQLKSYAGGSPI